MKRVIVAIVSLYIFCQVSHAQQNEFGGNLGYGGGDGVTPSVTYDMYVGRKIYKDFMIKLSYYKANSTTGLENTRLRDSFIDSDWISEGDTSSNPLIEYNLLTVYSLGLQLPINRFNRGSISIYAGLSYSQTKDVYIRSSGSSSISPSFVHTSKSGIHLQLDVLYTHELTDLINFNFGVYLIEGIFQFGFRAGPSFSF